MQLSNLWLLSAQTFLWFLKISCNNSGASVVVTSVRVYLTVSDVPFGPHVGPHIK